MSRSPKITPKRGPVGNPPAAAGSRNFPAWIDGEARAIALPAAEPRVRDNLVLRVVAKGKTLRSRGPSDVRRAC